MPQGYSATLSTFHKLLLIRSWCPDRTVPMAKIYVRETMGKQVCTYRPSFRVYQLNQIYVEKNVVLLEVVVQLWCNKFVAQ